MIFMFTTATTDAGHVTEQSTFGRHFFTTMLAAQRHAVACGPEWLATRVVLVSRETTPGTYQCADVVVTVTGGDSEPLAADATTTDGAWMCALLASGCVPPDRGCV